MKFVKMQGIGNDYVFINAMEENIVDPSKLAVQISNRNYKVGSDGLILILPSEKADFFMDAYTADGSRMKMCGNGIRCFGKYVYDFGLTDKTTVTVETLSGIRTLRLLVKEGKVSSVCVEMGQPVLTPSRIPVLLEGESVVSSPLLINGVLYNITCVYMGSPHCITFVRDVEHMILNDVGPLFENNSIFPEKVNTAFVTVMDENNIKMRVWERYSDESLACGTGACAAAVAAILNNLTKERVKVHLLGGTLDIYWDTKSNNVYMEGPAETVFTGEIPE